MTESEKSLSKFIVFANKYAPNKVDEISSSISEMKKLVDRDMPVEATIFEHEEVNYYICPKCNVVEKMIEIENINYCRLCGKRLEME